MMEKFIIKGPNKLKGRVKISGSKNASLPILAASILSSGMVTINNIPKLNDVFTMIKMLRFLGCEVHIIGRKIIINSKRANVTKAPYELVKTMRASILVLGPLLSKFHHAEVSMPGGCAIGVRPIDLHINALRMMGAKLKIENGYITASVKGKLKGCEIYLDVPTVTGTENIIMAATLASGKTIIKNAAKEPEVINLIDMLNAMGANIESTSMDIIKIEGVNALKNDIEFNVINDRIEAGTFMCVALATHSSIEIEGAPLFAMDAIIDKFKEAGGILDIIDKNLIRVSGSRLKPINIKTMFYPGFSTDMQAQFAGVLVKARGVSVIEETIFENRFQHIAELKRMGADISVLGNKAIINGVNRITGAPVMATDLRASAALVISALSAEGITNILRIYHLDRGYEALEEKLKLLGADITRVEYDKDSIT